MNALTGTRVLELSRVLAGPWCGMVLADLGADVIKLESFDGDDTRGLGPPFLDGMSAYFACCNRNKRSLAIDLRAPSARPLLEALVREADVLVENYRTGGAESLGVGYEAMAAINPRLVYCSISGYGRTGPGAKLPGYDYVVQAEAGMMAITGPADGGAYKAGVAVADLATGQNAATAILAALLQRHRTGRGQRIDVSLFDSQLAMLANVGSNALFTGADAPRHGNAHASIVPYQAFRARDREFVLAVASEKLWIEACRALDRDDWLRDPRYGNNAARVQHRQALCADMAALFATEDAAHWLELFSQAGVPAAPINTVRQALDHPVATAGGMRAVIDGIPMVGSPLRLSASPPRLERAPPTLGQHSDEIAREYGFVPELLRHEGAIR
ncbi:CoA transferase [Arenimonas sp.]|uniref:CaiB/BaiF CoA transferase family protein n=1 Tax=Arenimonas sp. TaxID=1872635 RepID=UPI0025BE1D43|nr:CoA transferase [Arenimonas sp.]